MLYLPLAQTMQQLDILLLNRLDRYGMYVRALGSFADGQCITNIALATVHEGGDMLAWFRAQS